MRNKHVLVTGHTIHFEFPGKSGVKHSIDLQNRRLARIVKQCIDLPGYELFQYINETGDRCSIDSSDVNDYLRDIAGDNFTAKDFRTWAGSVLTCNTLRLLEPFSSETEAKRNIVAAIKSVAHELGNTPSVCRKCYVHPAVLEQYLNRSMKKIVTQAGKEERLAADLDAGLHEEERALLHLLRDCERRRAAIS
jgi:DNA topoisomerase-1